MPSKDYILWVDLETTGSDADSDIIEVGAVITDTTFQFNIVSEFESIAKPSHFYLQRLLENDIVRKMHTANGLLEEIQGGSVPTIGSVDVSMLEWLDSVYAAKQHIPLAGSGVNHFDRQFIRRLMPKVDARMTFWGYDVGNLRRTWELFGLRTAPLSKEKSHRALDDIKGHVEELRFYGYDLLSYKAQLEYELARA